MGELSGKVAIVTGASKGIGAAIARRFAEAGAAVAVNYASDKSGADRLVEEIKRAGGKAVAIQADVAKSADIKRLFAETKARFGTPSILVNNAGVFSFAPIEAVTEEDVERQFKVNVLGTLLASKEAVAAFDGAGGSIINLSTIASVNPVPNSVVYSSSKAAVDTITRALALELAPKKIRVNAIAPGATETEGTKTMGLNYGDRESDGHGHADGPHGRARRHRSRGAVPRVRPVIMADRRAHFSVGRAEIANVDAAQAGGARWSDSSRIRLSAPNAPPSLSGGGAPILRPCQDWTYRPHTAVYLPLKSRSTWHPEPGWLHSPVAIENGAVRTPNTGPITGGPLFQPLEL